MRAILPLGTADQRPHFGWYIPADCFYRLQTLPIGMRRNNVRPDGKQGPCVSGAAIVSFA